MRFFLAGCYWVFCVTLALTQPETDYHLEEVRRLLRSGQLDPALQEVNVLLDSKTCTTNQLAQAYYLQGICLHQKLLPKAALVSFKQALSQYYKSGDTLKEDFLATLYFHIGDVYGALSSPDSCQHYLEQALTIRTRLFGKNSAAAGFCWNSLGGLEAGRYRMGRAMEYRRRALDIFEQCGAYRHAFAVANNLALQCKAAGDNGKALLYMDKANQFWEKAGSSPSYRAIMLSNYAVLLAQAQQPQNAYARIASAWATQAETGDSTVWLEVSENHAELLRLLGQPGEAAKIDSMRLRRLLFWRPEGIGMIAHTHAALANDCYWAQQVPESLTHWDSAIALYQQFLQAQQPTLADAFRGKALCLVSLGDTAQAFFYFEKSLVANGFDAQKTERIIHCDIGFETFLARARLHYSLGHLYAALADMGRADSCILFQRLQLQVSESKRQLAAKARQAYEFGAEVASLCYKRDQDEKYLALAFHFSEQCKSIALAEALRTFGTQPPTNTSARAILDREESCRAKIQQLRDSLENDTTAHAAYYASELLNANIRYLALLDSIREQFPDYYNHKFEHTTISPDSLSAWCSAHDRSVVAWFITDQSILTFLFQSGQAPVLLSVPHDFDIEQAVQQLNNGISDWFGAPVRNNTRFEKSYYQYIAAARVLYDKLLLPLKPQLISRHISMIPDGALHHLTFDALLAERPDNPYDFHKLRFAAEEFRFSYGFSATLLAGFQTQAKPFEGECRAIAFAPFSYAEGALPDTCLGIERPLPSSEEQCLSAINTLHGCDPFLRTQATLERFLSLVNDAEYLHLATHGFASQADADSVFLLFADPDTPGKAWRLSALQISKLSLRIRLAVVSACFSGQGPIFPGEGMLSIARAFAIAGASSIIMTHWAVDDPSSNHLMQLFYANLSAGLTTEDALWKAKVELLTLNRGMQRLPYYWAGFSLIGAPK